MVVVGLWWPFLKNCAVVGVVIFGKIVLRLGLGLSIFVKLCWGGGCGAFFSKNCAVVVVVVFIF